MIIMKLKGGLGNQLFQYSLGRHLAAKHGTELKLDIRGYALTPNRQYDLHYFNVSSKIATDQDIARFRYSLPGRIGNIFKPYYRRTIISEQYFQFDGNILNSGPDAYLDGFWQSEKYFTEIGDIIRNELTLKAKPIGINETLLKEIIATESVSLHVRRGDYVSSTATNAFHGTCSVDYYQKAISMIANKITHPHFYIFSDDPQWTKENLISDFPTTFVVNNGSAAHEDLRLMANCRHFIIANSTFSWWGAWLSSSAGKLVIAPKQWFRDTKNNAKDLLPKDWIKL